MKTAEILLKKYGDKFVPLDRVAADYYGLTNQRYINSMAEKKEFPGLRPFKPRKGKNSPWLVDIENLAEALDNCARG